MTKDITAPAILDRLTGIPVALSGGFHRIKQAQIMAPGQKCNNLLHKFQIRPSLGKRPHVAQISRREAGHLGKGPPKIRRKTVDDLRTPALDLLAGKDIATDIP